jgi:hypothetical protein
MSLQIPEERTKYILLNKSATSVACSLAYSLKFDCDDLNARINIVSDFWNSMNRHGIIHADEVEIMVKFTHEKMEAK